MIKGKLVQIKAVERENLPTHVEWLNDKDIRQYLAFDIPYPTTIQEEIKWFEAKLRNKSERIYAIHTIEGDKLIGTLGIHNINWKNQMAMVSIFIGNKDYLSKGYGTEAMRLLLYLAFQELNLQRVELGVFSFNERAIKSYQKVGFVEEGRRRRFIYRNGQFHDDVMMSILKEEYLERYQEEDEKRWQQF